MSYADHQLLRLPDGFKLFYYQRQDGWAVVLASYDPDLQGLLRCSPPHVRTLVGLKDWIEEHWEDLEEVLNLSQINRPLMHCVVKDLRTGNL